MAINTTTAKSVQAPGSPQGAGAAAGGIWTEIELVVDEAAVCMCRMCGIDRSANCQSAPPRPCGTRLILDELPVRTDVAVPKQALWSINDGGEAAHSPINEIAVGTSLSLVVIFYFPDAPHSLSL